MARTPKAPEPAALPEKPKRGKKEETAATTETKAPTSRRAAKAPEPVVEETLAKTGGNIIDRSKYAYETHKDQKTVSGRASVDNGDVIAAALRGKSAQEVVALVEENGGTANPNWMTLKNQGLVRMAAGNVLRNMMRNNGFLKVDGKKIKAPTEQATAPTGKKAA